MVTKEEITELFQKFDDDELSVEEIAKQLKKILRDVRQSETFSEKERENLKDLSVVLDQNLDDFKVAAKRERLGVPRTHEELREAAYRLRKIIQETGDTLKNLTPKGDVTPPKTYTNSTGIEFVLIPAGEFDMGSPATETVRRDDEGPVHRVKIAEAFYMGKYEVTQKQWYEVMGTNPSYFKGDDMNVGTISLDEMREAPSYFKGDELPVENISWDDVQEFIKYLNQMEKMNKYRLPSEAEWEYAARAGTTTIYSFGDYESELGDYAWYAENSGSRPPKKGDYRGYDSSDWKLIEWKGKTHPVGQKKPNPWGLHDMHGNVYEWVQDIYHNNYKGAPTDGRAWKGYSSFRVYRGGSWYDNASYCRSAFRYDGAPGSHNAAVGFRLVRDL